MTLQSWVRKPGWVLGCAAASFAAAGCGGSASGFSSANTASEIGESALSGALNSTEPGGTQASYLRAPARSFFARLSDLLLPQSWASTACPTIVSQFSSCVSGSGTVTMTYSSCTFGSSATVWNGSQSISFSGGCPGSLTLANLQGQTVTRAFGAGTTEQTSAGVKTTLDTTTASTSGWDSSVTGVGNGMTALFTASDGTRTLTILGLHLHAVDSGGNTLFDHTVSSGGISVSGAGTSRTVPTGATFTVQHNVAKYTGKINVTTALTYGTAGCCHPTAGTLTTQLSGSESGIETLTFNSTCGSATYTDPSGKSTSITLTHCY
jgi:hypothetical protein